MILALYIIFGLIVVTVTGWMIFLYLILPKLMAEAKVLTQENIQQCLKAIEEKRSYPFLCKRAVVAKKCPRYPCSRVRRENV